MRSQKDIEVFDGDYEILFSNEFVIFSDTIKIKIFGWTFEFIFTIDSQNTAIRFTSENLPNQPHFLRLNMFNFLGALPAGMIAPAHILKNVRLESDTTDSTRDIYFGLKTGGRVGQNGAASVSITFYSQTRYSRLS